jgi:UDP-N-acetylmuramoyl-L-alanyl-D-glutamate--2,6-diaminopimelate ligase
VSSPDPLRPTAVPSRTLEEVAARLGVPAPAGAARVRVSGVTLDSRAVRPGDLYAGLPGAHAHGARFAEQARADGAVALLTDAEGAASAAGAGLATLVVEEPRHRLGALAAWIYGEPAQHLRTVGITGTNGKTTTAYLLEAGMRAAGLSTGLLGTVETRVAGQTLASVRTTPEAPELQALLALMRERGVDAVAMEISSHALVLGRVDGLVVDVAVFANLGQDHLDFHPSLEDYFLAKASLFTPARARQAVIWTDDPYGVRLVGMARAAGLPVTTVGTADFAGSAGPEPVDVRVGPVRLSEVDRPGRPAGQAVELTGLDRSPVTVEIQMPGRFNVANAALALTAAHRCGIDVTAAAAGMADCRVPGRMEQVDAGQRFLAVVDFAHTPDAVARALEALRSRTDGRLITVLGCGGDRDRAKRPVMGAVAAARSDVLVVTDDNPRGEDPAAIRAAVAEGARSVETADQVELHEVADRAGAIALAVRLAGPGDTVAVLGKGHEQGQELAGVVHPFDDRAALREAITRQPTVPA